MKISSTNFRFYSVWLVVAGLTLMMSRPASTVGQEAANPAPAVTDAKQPSRSQIITLTIDYGDGFQKRFVNIPWHDGMRILDAMQRAKQHKRAGFDFAFQGRGATALLKRIDDVSNQGGGKRNWIFYVNQRKGDRSFGIWKLQPGDEVLWRFETYL